MKIVITAAALSAALLTVSLSAPLNAQSPADKGKDYTKVYAYKKMAPNPQPTESDVTGLSRMPTPHNMANPNIPYGSPAWWREQDRVSGGDGGSP